MNVDVFEGLFLHRFPNSTAHDPDTLLGMDVTITNESISLSQEKLIDKGLKLLGLTECKAVNTPLSVAVQLKPASQEEKNEFSKLRINYRTHRLAELSLMPNSTGPCTSSELLHCWKYVKGTRKLHLKLRPVNDDL
ncbi:hypothetical protein VP01_4265g1 [Puccinia sorghi]|uniref:Uncharacterized protein n=1 Tax=Puccinia sorghi TaxID=27349 RepID=A0A0L6UR71_9BASI|nr:hypothetical protein VP01_4265g1 [Puccinia sorghi]